MTVVSLTPIWTGKQRLEEWRVPVPEPREGALLLRVLAAGLCGTDHHLIASEPPYPMVLGHEICGEIVAFGDRARHRDADDRPVETGDRVVLFPWISCGRCWACVRYGPGAATCPHGFIYGVPFERTGAGERAGHPNSVEDFPGLSGGYGEYVYVHPGTAFWKLDPDVPDHVGVLLDPLAVAVRTVEVADSGPDAVGDPLGPDSVALVQGAGPVGLLCVAVLKEAGVGRIILHGSRAARLDLGSRFGADVVVDIRSTDLDERLGRVLGATNGRGADLVLDCTNQPHALGEALRSVRRLGTVVETGNVVNAGETVPLDPAADLCQRSVRLIGMSAIPARSFARARSLLGRHRRIPFSELVTHRFPRHRAMEAIAAMDETAAVKVILAEEADT